MNDIKEKMKMAYIKTFRIINKCFCLKKIEETKVVFEAFSGSVYGCNPKYISKKIHEIYGRQNKTCMGGQKSRSLL